MLFASGWRTCHEHHLADAYQDLFSAEPGSIDSSRRVSGLPEHRLVDTGAETPKKLS